MGYVYCISQENKYYKIGRSESNSRARLYGMQTGNPHELSLLWELECQNYCDVEKFLHYKYADNNVRGEWFEFTPIEVRLMTITALDYIGNNKVYSYANAMYREMLDYGHISSKSSMTKDEYFYKIHDLSNRKIYTLVDIDKWISEGYSVKDAIIDLGMLSI